MADRDDQASYDDSVDEAFVHGDELPGDDLPSRGLLSFYDRLRAKIATYVAERGGAGGDRVAAALLLVPDVFVLLLRLLLDPEVPRAKRALIGSAIAYFVLPVDLLPEAMIGPAGFVDDLVLSLAVLSQSFGADLEPWARRYWSGSQDLRKVLRDVLQSAHGLLGTDLHGRLRKALARRGIELDEAAEVLTMDGDHWDDEADTSDDRGYGDPYSDPYGPGEAEGPLPA